MYKSIYLKVFLCFKFKGGHSLYNVTTRKEGLHIQLLFENSPISLSSIFVLTFADIGYVLSSSMIPGHKPVNP